MEKSVPTKMTEFQKSERSEGSLVQRIIYPDSIHSANTDLWWLRVVVYLPIGSMGLVYLPIHEWLIFMVFM